MFLIIDAREFNITPNPYYNGNKIESDSNQEVFLHGVVRAVTPTDRYDTYANDVKTIGKMFVRVSHSLKKTVKMRFPGPENESICDEVTRFIMKSMMNFDIFQKSIQIGITIDIDTKSNDLLMDSFIIDGTVYASRKTL